MSALPTYVLVCDGQGCNERFVTSSSPPRRIDELRKRAGAEGWSNDFQPLAKTGQGRPFDFCPRCTTQRAA